MEKIELEFSSEEYTLLEERARELGISVEEYLIVSW